MGNHNADPRENDRVKADLSKAIKAARTDKRNKPPADNGKGGKKS